MPSDNRGLKYPSVTEILSPYIDTQWFTPESRDRGSAVHAAISAPLQGLWVKTLAPDHQPYFDSARRWIDMAVDKVILVEERLYDNKLKICGKPDLICTLNGSDRLCLVDFKTSQSPVLWWPLQLTFYRHLSQEFKGLIPTRQLSVMTKKNGSGCKTKEYPICFEDKNRMNAAIILYKYFNPKEA